MTDTIRSPRQKLQLIHNPLCFQNPPIRSIYRKNPQSVRFLGPNRSIRKPIHPAHFEYFRKAGAKTIKTNKEKKKKKYILN